jgi:hypothetical protein
MAKRRLVRAVKAGFYLEAIALEESMMADRLESLLASSGAEIKFQTVESACRNARKRWSTEDVDDVLGRVTTWSNHRAAALHQMVKVGQGYDATWRQRLATARATAEEGLGLVSDVDTFVRRMQRKTP